MLNPSDFEAPAGHPWGMLEGKGLANTSQCESVLAWMLGECIRQGSWDAIATIHQHPSLVNAGMLDCVGEKLYKLTDKSIGLLYGYYRRR